MGLYYPSTHTFPVFGTVVLTKTSDDTITAAALTGVTLESTYQTETAAHATKTFKTTGYSKLNLDLLYTEGATESANTMEVKFECSPDGINFYRIPNESVSSGTSTLFAREFTFAGADAAAATISIGLDLFYKYVKISAKETGVASNKGTVFGQVTLLGR